MELLQKYFPDQFVNDKFYIHRISSDDEKTEVLRMSFFLTNKFGLKEFAKEIVLIIGAIRANWNITQSISKIDIEEYNRMKKDIQTLKYILEQDLFSLSKIDFCVKKENGKVINESIVSKNALSTILKYVDIEELKIEVEDKEMAIRATNWVYNKESFYLNFVKRTLFPLFEMLKNETHLNNKSNNKIYELVYLMSITAGVEWSAISTQDDFKNYLKKTFNNIRKEKVV